MIIHQPNLDRYNLSSLFTPDILTAEQLGDTTTNRYTCQPERRLVFAIFEDAVHCLVGYRDARTPALRLLYREAREWFTTSDPGTILFSFINCCEILGYEAGTVRTQLAQYLRVPTDDDALTDLAVGTGTGKTRTARNRATHILRAMQSQ